MKNILFLWLVTVPHWLNREQIAIMKRTKKKISKNNAIQVFSTRGDAIFITKSVYISKCDPMTEIEIAIDNADGNTQNKTSEMVSGKYMRREHSENCQLNEEKRQTLWNCPRIPYTVLSTELVCANINHSVAKNSVNFGFFVSINSFCVHIFMIGETVVADWRCHRCAARTALRIDDKQK